VKLRELIPIRLASLSTLKFSRRFSNIQTCSFAERLRCCRLPREHMAVLGLSARTNEKHHQYPCDFESNLVTVILSTSASAKSMPAVIPADV